MGSSSDRIWARIPRSSQGGQTRWTRSACLATIATATSPANMSLSRSNVGDEDIDDAGSQKDKDHRHRFKSGHGAQEDGTPDFSASVAHQRAPGGRLSPIWYRQHCGGERGAQQQPGPATERFEEHVGRRAARGRRGGLFVFQAFASALLS